MKKALILLILLAISAPCLAYERVDGYTRSNGTYVQPYVRTESNNTQSDNYSTRGNYSPYSGRKGTVNIYTPQNNYGNNSGYHKNYNPYQD